jgi:hypothetical protein
MKMEAEHSCAAYTTKPTFKKKVTVWIYPLYIYFYVLRLLLDVTPYKHVTVFQRMSVVCFCVQDVFHSVMIFLDLHTVVL